MTETIPGNQLTHHEVLLAPVKLSARWLPENGQGGKLAQREELPESLGGRPSAFWVRPKCSGSWLWLLFASGLEDLLEEAGKTCCPEPTM